MHSIRRTLLKSWWDVEQITRAHSGTRTIDTSDNLISSTYIQQENELWILETDLESNNAEYEGDECTYHASSVTA